jgi:carboxypeptidase C (cathepsin A)
MQMEMREIRRHETILTRPFDGGTARPYDSASDEKLSKNRRSLRSEGGHVKTILRSGLVILLLTGVAAAADEAAKATAAKTESAPAETEKPPKEESSVTEHSIRIGGAVVPYKATAGTILLKDDEGNPTASVFYVAYTRTDVKSLADRPLTFSYNGGPGSSSIWLHMGALGPRRIVTADAGPTPPPPYRIVDNADSIIDKTDLVMIDPVGTGFSHAVGKAKNKDFWGVDEDARSLARFIVSYVTRNGRWNSPKYLLGESYGTTRSAVIVNDLQGRDNMAFNGVVLVSMALDFETIAFHRGHDISYVLYIPSYAATAWYHKTLAEPPASLDPLLKEAREFAFGPYADALRKGDAIGAAEKQSVAKTMARLTGLPVDYCLKANLRVDLAQFMVELQRRSGLTTGRLDSRFSGPTPDILSENAEYDPQETAISSAFTAAFHHYLHHELKFDGDRPYEVESDEVGRNWNWKRTGRGRGFGWPGSTNVGPDLAEAIVGNPNLQVEVECGIYDMATPFAASEWTVDHLGLPEKVRGNVSLKYYDAGHMMYVHEADLAKLKANVAAFIDRTSSHQPMP